MPLAAQDRKGAEVMIKGGYSWGDVSNKGILPGELNERSGFAAGIGFTTTGTLGFGIEALYAQRGLTSDTPADEFELDYIDVPAYLRLSFPTNSITPFVYAGPQISFEIRCRAGDIDCADDGRETTSYAGIIGAGIRFGGRAAGLFVEGRYIYGLSDLKLSTVFDDDSFETRSFMILAGFAF
jgi:hypothetical protein